MKEKHKVVGIGEVLWDMLPQGKVLGGAPANFAYHAWQLGAEAHVISAIGKDDLGKEILRSLSENGLNLHLKQVDHPTSTVIVHMDDKGVPSFEICEDVAWDFLSLEDEDKLLAKQTDAVCFGSLAQRNSISGKAITDFIRSVPEDALRVFDINLRQHFYSKDLIEKSLQSCNILKINEDELQIVAKIFGWSGNEESICKEFLKIPNLMLLAYTRGADGSYLYTREEVTFMDTPKIDVVDTVGAGDAFTAGLVMGLLYKKTLKECHSIAVEIAAHVCRQRGAMPAYTKEMKEYLLQINKTVSI